MFDPMDATQEEQAALAASTATTPNYTVNDLCLGALKLMGIEEAGETSTYDDLADALFFLNLD